MRSKPQAAANPGPRKRRRWLRWTLGVLGILAGAYFFFQYEVVDPKLKPLIEQKLAEAVHSPVSIQSVRAGLTGDVVLNKVSLSMPGQPWESHVQVDQVSVSVELINLLFHRKPLENCLDSLSFVRPQIMLVRNQSPSAPVSGAPLTQAPPPVAVPIPLFPVPKVSVRDGSFSVQGEKTPRPILTGLNFDASTTNRITWGLSLSAHSPEAGSQGFIRFDGGFQPENLKIRGVVQLQQWPLSSLGSTLKETTGWDLSTGTISAESPVVFQQGRDLWYDAKADVSGASLKTPGPVFITFSNISGRVLLRPKEINIANAISYQVGQTQWKATGFVPLDGRPLSVKASTDQLYLSTVLNDILKLNQVKTEGTGSASLVVSGPLQAPIVAATAKLGPSKINEWPVDSFEIKGRFEDQVLYVESAWGKLMGGSFTADGLASVLDQPSSPVSLRVNLVDVEASQAASILGISETQGTMSEEFQVGGTREKYTLSTSGQMDLTRTLRDSVVHYLIRHSVQLKDGKLVVSATLNEKSKLEAVFKEEPEDWKLEKFSVTTGKKSLSGKWSGKGVLPKAEDQPIDIEITGLGATLEETQLFHDQFPDISGSVDVSVKVGGTKKEPAATAVLTSKKITISTSRDDEDNGLKPQPLKAAVSWKPDELSIDQLEIGDIFSASGKLGLTPQAPLDLKINAEGFPIRLIAEIAQWNNPPQPFEGLITGHLRLSGTQKSPILEGDDIVLDSLKVGDWYASKVDASLDMVEGKLLVKKLKLQQDDRSLSVSGSWDTHPQSGVMNLRFKADGFQLGQGPFLTGDFLWDAKATGDPFWANWTGSFSTAGFSLKDLKNNVYTFNDYSMTADCVDSVLTGKFRLGKNVSGSAVLDASAEKTTLRGLVRIAPCSLAEAPELTQFLPKTIKMTGTISGAVKLKTGTFDELPMEGDFTVTDGSIQKYDFDRMEFTFDGNKAKISPRFSLARDLAHYTLSGTLESPKAFWDSDSQININGPVEREKLKTLLTLMGIDTEKHAVSGEVNGNLSVVGPLVSPTVAFSVTGENLRYDNNLVPSAELHFSYAGGKMALEENKITLSKGEIDIQQGSAYPSPDDPSLWVLDLSGSTKDLPIAMINFTSQIHLSGKLAMEEKENRPTFDGLLSIIETSQSTQTVVTPFYPLPVKVDSTNKSSPFDIALSVHKKVLEFKPLENSKPQLVGEVDLSQAQKLLFNNLRLVNASGSFSVDGNLDLNGPCSLVSDSKNIPIQEIGKWILPSFPLSGTGSYHLVFEGTLEDPIFTASLSVMDGQVGDLKFDLLDGELKSKDNTLFLGDEENPITLSRQGVFTFTLGGKLPFAFTEDGMKKVRNREMDVTANMEKGDFSLILLEGWAKKASGNMDFSAHIGGTLDDPDVTMDLDLNKCQLVPPMVAQSIDDLSGRIKIRHNHLAVEDLNARIGQGRVFITSPPVDESKMVLVDFIPQYLDFRVQTVGTHGLWLSIPTIMRKGEWGEIYFYGNTPNDPMVITGPLEQPVVSGTALLDTGHYTFPPIEALDEHGQKIEYRELAGVTFDLKLLSGKNTWYSNDFNTCYLELKVDPGDVIKIEGKDADRTPEQAGIKCYGTASSSQGFLIYLNHRFDMQNGWIAISKGRPPSIWGKATSRLTGVDVVSAGAVRMTDVDSWVNFKGTFGNIDFSLDSNPQFDPTDHDKSQKMLLSYIMFGKDMTGYTSQQLQAYYQQDFGQTATETAINALNTMALNEATRAARSYVQQWLGTDIQFSGNPIPGGYSTGAAPVTGVSTADATGNSLAGYSSPLFKMELVKPLDSKFSVRTDIGLNRGVTGDLSPTGSVGLDLNLTQKLKLSGSVGQNDWGQNEGKVGIELSQPLPDVIGPKKGDTEKPNFERFDIYPVGPGKFSLQWVTDKVTKCEIRVLGTDGQLIKDIPENKPFDYRHDMTIDGLDPTQDVQIQISAKDPNGNERIVTQKASASVE